MEHSKPTSGHRSIVVVDVESYGDRGRTTHHRLAARDGMYRVMQTAFEQAGLPWVHDWVDDAGDSLLIILPGDLDKVVLADLLPSRVAAGLRRHNDIHSNEARLRLRMAVHAGEMHYDAHGKSSEEMIFACRILDAAEAKRSLEQSTATVVLIASVWFYDSVIRHHPETDPASFRLIDVDVKETQSQAWVRLVDGHLTTPLPAVAPRPHTPLGLADLRPIVEALLVTPGFDTREGRDLVLHELPFASVIRRSTADRPDIVSIVRITWHYPDGPESLLEAVRFYAKGSEAMTTLERLVREWQECE